jgi:hypothetical protein
MTVFLFVGVTLFYYSTDAEKLKLADNMIRTMIDSAGNSPPRFTLAAQRPDGRPSLRCQIEMYGADAEYMPFARKASLSETVRR